MIFINHDYPDHWLDKNLPEPYICTPSGYTPHDHIYLWLETTSNTGYDEPVSGFDWED